MYIKITMESQIKKSVLSLRKIATIPAECQVDTTRGDIDIYVPSTLNMIRRQLWDGRNQMVRVLKEKYADTKAISLDIIDSGKYVESLKIIHSRLSLSKEGLTMIKRNPRYSNDMEIKNNIEHLLEDEIPQQMLVIEKFLEKRGMTIEAAPSQQHMEDPENFTE